MRASHAFHQLKYILCVNPGYFLTKMQSLFSFVCVMCLVFDLNAAILKQTAGAKGILMCGDKPLANTLVKLWDEDNGPDPDEELAKTKTDAQGRFQLSGSTSELTNIDLRLKIYHDCNDGWKPCQRKVKMVIPDSYISRSDRVTKWFDAGTLNMETKWSGEERDCSLDGTFG